MAVANTPAFTMYTTTWCGDCRRLKRELEAEGIAFREINIEADPSAADYVVRLNGGNQTVPTVVFSDGAVMAEPSGRQIVAHLYRLETQPELADQ
jgi:mycoredoxin